MWASFIQLVFCTYAITKFPKHFQILQKKILSNNKVAKKSCLKNEYNAKLGGTFQILKSVWEFFPDSLGKQARKYKCSQKI